MQLHPAESHANLGSVSKYTIFFRKHDRIRGHNCRSVVTSHTVSSPEKQLSDWYEPCSKIQTYHGSLHEKGFAHWLGLLWDKTSPRVAKWPSQRPNKLLICWGFEDFVLGISECNCIC